MAAPKGNKFNQEWTLENSIPRFKDALKYAQEDNDCLCMQDAIFKTGMPVSTFYYLVDNHEELESIKKDIMAHVIARVNKNALQQKFNASAAIWRMKQLGEKDEQHIKQTTQGKTEIIVQNKKQQKDVEDFIDKLESE